MKKIKSLIQHIAPTLAAALGGPFAGVATKFIADKLIGDSKKEQGFAGNIEQVLGDLLNDSGNLQKLKELDREFETKMRELEVDVFKLEVEDRKDARAMAKDNQMPQIVISLLFITAYFSLLVWIFYTETSDVLNMKKGENSLMGEFQILMGVLTAGIPQILSFWFGGIGPFKR